MPLVNLTREQIWSLLKVCDEKDVWKLPEGDILRQAYFRLVAQVTDTA